MSDPSESAPGADSRPLDARVDQLASEVAELRRDVARLWIAYGRHDRLLAGATADSVDEGGSAAATAELSELDRVLAAIERATEALESAYEDEPATGTAGDEPGR